MCGVLCRRYRRRGSNGGGFCVNTSRRGRVSPPPGASSFLSVLKESYQRKPLETTFQDFLGAGTSRCCACGRGMGRFVLPARVPFFFCKKKGTKENHSNLRFNNPLARGGFRRRGGELAFPWRGGGLWRPHFFLRRKKCEKESRLDLRSKGPLARYGSCKIGGADLAELARRGTLSVQGTACTSCAAAADNSEGRGWYAGRFWRLSNRAFAAARRQR